ncbi:MAG TPA: alpha/beta hydrolase [Terriglobales bacterium]|nr:alpha/beta hydrolase [Terriglobales bacterium]
MLSWTTRALNVRQVSAAPGQGRRPGADADVVVLAHGFGADQRVWQPYIDDLAQRYDVILYDLACSASADPAFFDLRRHNTLEGYVDDLLAILDDLRVHRCRIVGHSVSGMIALLAAARRPALVDKLITIGASASYLNTDDYQGGFDAEQVADILVAAARSYRDWAVNYAAFAISRPPEDPATLNFTGSLTAMRPDIAVATAKMILLGDYRDCLEAIETPTVLLQSLQDPAVPFSAARYLLDHLRNCEMEIIDTTGHMPHMTSVELVKAALARHLDIAPEAESGRD